jgi:hypothetical protein
MSWWEWFFNTAAGAASLMSLILGGSWALSHGG